MGRSWQAKLEQGVRGLLWAKSDETHDLRRPIFHFFSLPVVSPGAGGGYGGGFFVIWC